MRMQAIFNDTVIADSDQTEVVEGNHYFPADAVRSEYLSPSVSHTTCHWKGVASYYTVTAGGDSSTDAAWFYPDPSPAAKNITGHIAFWRGVTVRPA